MHFTTLVQTCLATNEVVVKLHLFVVCFTIPIQLTWTSIVLLCF